MGHLFTEFELFTAFYSRDLAVRRHRQTAMCNDPHIYSVASRKYKVAKLNGGPKCQRP